VNLINLTGHDVTIIDENGKSRTYPSSGHLRVSSRTEPIDKIRNHGLTITLLEITEEYLDLPAEKDGTMYIVSGVTAARARRNDLVTPSRIARDKDGKVVGCHALARVRC